MGAHWAHAACRQRVSRMVVLPEAVLAAGQREVAVADVTVDRCPAAITMRADLPPAADVTVVLSRAPIHVARLRRYGFLWRQTAR